MSAQTLTTTATSLVQLSADPAVRVRVMAILLAIALGGTPVGAPLVGWVADTFGLRSLAQLHGVPARGAHTTQGWGTHS